MIKRNKQTEWTVLAGIVLLLLIVIGVLVWFFAKVSFHERDMGYGLFSWEKEVLDEEQWDRLLDCVEQTDVTVLYQQFSKNDLKQADVAPFVKMLYDRGVDVYALIGEAEWSYEVDGEHLVKWIRRVATYNVKQGSDTKIRGVMVDIEPYLLKEWDAGDEARAELMQGYLEGIKEGYAYAKGHGLVFLVCIPNYYDSTCEEILRELIAKGCDGVAVMNYDRRDEYGQMEREVELAKESNKEIICIYELQESGRHGLEEMHTYAEEGLEALWKSAQDLEERFGYDKLSFAYHYYKPLRQILDQ